MLRVQRPNSSDSDDIESVARHDLTQLANLQRQLRRAEGNKKQYADQTQNVIRRQKEMIRALEEENGDLEKNLSLAASAQSDQKDKLVTDRFHDLLDKQAVYFKQIEEEKLLITSLDARVKKLEQQISKRRRDVGGLQVGQRQHITVSKQLRVMENRLDKALVRFNTALATNTRMRDKIDHMRQEKKVFEGLRKKLQRTLADCKREMGEVIEESTSAYHSRGDAQSKLLALKEKADKELAQYNTELKELIRVIDHDRKLKEFMSRKDQERTEAHMEIEEARRKKMADKASEREQTVTSYEDAFQCIQEATSITDIDQLVSKFIEVEDENFALFNYVNELSGSMEQVQEQIEAVKRDMVTFEKEGVIVEQQRKELMLTLEQELNDSQRVTQETDKQLTLATKVMEQLKTGVDSLFSKIGCDNGAITELLGGHAGVTESTILQYLGLVEQRTNELLQLQAFISAKESDDPEAINKFLMTHTSVAGLAQPSLLLPSTSSEYSMAEEDVEATPLTHDQLRQRAVQGISKREAKKSQPTHSPPPTAAAASRGKGLTPTDKKRMLATR